MDGRWMLVAGGLLCLVGCTPFGTSQVTGGAEKDPVQLRSAKPPSEKPSSGVSAEAITALAQTNLDAAALNDDKPQRQREQLVEKSRLGFQRALTVDPNYLPAQLGLAKLHDFRGDIEQATRSYERALEIDSQSADIWAEYAHFKARHRDWDGAAQAIGMSLRIDPQNRIFAKHLGFFLVLAGKTEQGHAWLAKAMPPADAHFNTAMALSQLGHRDQALQQASMALRVDPSHRDAGQLVVQLSGGSIQPDGASSASSLPYRMDSDREPNTMRAMPHGSVPELEPVPDSHDRSPMPTHASPNELIRVGQETNAAPEPILSSSWDDRDLFRNAPEPRLSSPPHPQTIQGKSAAEQPTRVRVMGVTSSTP